MNTSSQASAKVGWTCQDESKMLGPHEPFPGLLDGVLHFAQALTESFKHSLHVATLLHRDHPGVVFFVDPNEEVLLVIVPDATSIRPVSCHTSTCKKWGHWFVEEEVILNQLVLLLFGHILQRIVLAFEFTCKSMLELIHSLAID